jgi:hypothetical protein
MKRVWIAFFLAPLLVSAPFGVFGLIALYFLLLVTLVLAVPLFFLCRRMKWLQWWHALLAGLLCALCFVIFDAWMTPLKSPLKFDQLISANNVIYLGWGVLVSVVFWWIGIFRNPAFPFVPRRPPISFVLVLPLFLAGFAVREGLAITHHQGRVLSIFAPATEPGLRKATVQLTGGPTMEADVTDTWWEGADAGKCVHLMNYWSTLRMRRVYKLLSQFGGGVDKC